MINTLYDIHNFFFNYYISSTFIGAYRILTVLVLFIYLLYIYKDLVNFSKYDGIFPYKDFKTYCLCNFSKFNIFYYYDNYNLNYIIIYLFFISGIFSIIGLFTNISLLLFIFCLQSLQHRISPILSSGGDIIANVILYCLFFIDSGAGLSIDSLLFNKDVYVNAWSIRLIQITISFGFMFAGIIKFSSNSWRQGEAIKNAMLFTTWSKNKFKKLFKCKIIYLTINYSVVMYQIFSPIFFWTPNLTIFGIIIGVTLHFLMILNLKIGYFGPITIVAILSFLANYFRL